MSGDWKQQFANEVDKAIAHPITQEAIDELLFNLRSSRNRMEYYGLLKICNVVGHIARAQALGIDPETLRMTDDEASEVVRDRIRAVADAGNPVIVVDGGESEVGP